MLQNLKIIEKNNSGWWFQPLWNILVSWDYSSQSMESHKIHVPRHKAAILSTNPIKANLVGHESIMYVYIEQWVYINIPVVIRGRPVHDSRNNFCRGTFHRTPWWLDGRLKLGCTPRDLKFSQSSNAPAMAMAKCCAIWNKGWAWRWWLLL